MGNMLEGRQRDIKNVFGTGPFAFMAKDAFMLREIDLGQPAGAE